MLAKQELQTELREFMLRFAESIGRIYGNSKAGGLLGHPAKNLSQVTDEEAVLDDCPLWTALNDMYDYGILGLRRGLLGFADSLDAEYADAELFLRGLESLELYFQEDSVPMPHKAIRVVRTAVARHLLDGGSRWTDYEDGQFAALSLAELALLADMDERSVRNAANPKLANPLVTNSTGKRTYVEIEDARRWLEGRKGFVPSQDATAQTASPSASVAAITLSADLVDRLKATAAARGLSVEELIAAGISTQEVAS